MLLKRVIVANTVERFYKMKNNTIEFEFGEMLMLYRVRANLSKKGLAKRMKVHPVTISNYETSKTFPSYKNLIRLRKVLGADFDDVLEIFGETNGRFYGRIS